MTGVATASGGLLERETELERITSLLKHASGGLGGMLLVEGEAGVGKTALLAAAAEQARGKGLNVLSGRGAALERNFPHGLVRQLYEPVVRRASAPRRRRLLRGAAALAAPIVGVSEATARASTDAAYATNHGLYWLTVELSDERPMMLIIDDVHWCDRATLLFLDYLGRRLDGLPVLVACALRPGESGPNEELLDGLRGVPLAEILRPALLSEDGSTELIRRLTGKGPPAEFARATHATTGGNPFLLHELLRALADEGLEPDAAAVERVRTLGPQSISRVVIGRLAALWPEARRLAQAVAILDTDAELRHVAALARLDYDEALEAADALTRARVLAPGPPLRFLHPIIRQAVYDEMPPGRLARDHARAARILEEGGSDRDRAAVHLLRADPSHDPWVVEQLRAAGTRALGRGAPHAASTFLRRALEEPPTSDRRPPLLLELGRAARLAGEPDAYQLLSQALEEAHDIDIRVEVAEELGLTLAFFGELERGLDILQDTASALAVDREAQLRLETAFLMVSALSDDAALRGARRIDELLPRVTGRTRNERMLLAAAALHRANGMSGSIVENLDLAERAGAFLEEIVAEGSAIGLPWIGPLAILAFYDRHEAVERLFELILDNARRTGSLTELTIYWAMRMRMERFYGDLHGMEDCARRALDVAPVLGRFLAYLLISNLACSLHEQGRDDEALVALEEHGLTREVAPMTNGRALLVVRAHLRAAASKDDQALADARDAAARAARRGASQLALGLSWSTALALVAAAAPREEAVAEALRERAIARRFGSRSVEGMATLVLGIAEGDARSIGRFDEAARALEASRRPLDYARALIELGSALRRANRRSDARGPLERGMDLAHRCGALPLAERARDELRATGARPRKLVVTGVDSLTASERRVAKMAAGGMTNTQIAQALFVTRKTVETHLGHIYRKLDLGSRGELGAALEEH